MSNFTEWRNAGESSKYPFSESSTNVSLSGWTMPEGLFSDCQIRVPFGYEPPELSSLSAYNNGIIGTVLSGDIEIGTFFFPRESMSGKMVDITNSSGVIVGSIVTGRNGEKEFKSIQNQKETFAKSSLLFESSSVFYYPENVLNSITVNNSTITGRVILVEGEGINIIKESVNSIRIDVVGDRGKQELEISNCNRKTTGIPLKKINTNSPDKYGVYTIQAGEWARPERTNKKRQALKIEPSGNTLIFSIVK